MFSSVCFKIKLQSQHLVDLLIPKYLCRRVLFLRLLFHLVVRFSTVGRSLCYCCLLPSFISLAEKKKKKIYIRFYFVCEHFSKYLFLFISHECDGACVLEYLLCCRWTFTLLVYATVTEQWRCCAFNSLKRSYIWHIRDTNTLDDRRSETFLPCSCCSVSHFLSVPSVLIVY